MQQHVSGVAICRWVCRQILYTFGTTSLRDNWHVSLNFQLTANYEILHYTVPSVYFSALSLGPNIPKHNLSTPLKVGDQV